MKTPHLVQYQGSKRNIAPDILHYFPYRFNRLIEPFCGTAAVSILTAIENRTNSFILNDINRALINMLQFAINEPDTLAYQYQEIWNGQFQDDTNNVDYFNIMREKFNLNPEPALMLFMLARVVKGAVRYNNSGQMNQSCDKRRKGTKPSIVTANAIEISKLLKNKTEFFSLDYKEVLKMAVPGDLVYMDPPYQGTSNTRDDRYFQGVNFDDFVNSLEELNRRNIDFIVSYDGKTGDKKHGKDLPIELELTHLFIDAGTSSQSTLLGKNEKTYESLYLSRNIAEKNVFTNNVTEINLRNGEKPHERVI